MSDSSYWDFIKSLLSSVWSTTVGKVCCLVALLALGVGVCFGVSSCSTVRAVVANKATGTKTTVTISGSQTTSPSVKVSTQIDTLDLL